MKKLLSAFSFGLCAVALYCVLAYAASADVTLGSGGREIECDGTQHAATLNVRGGSILNKSSTSVWVDLNAGTVTTSSGSTSIEIATGTSIKLPDTCPSFTFKTSGSTSYLIYLSK